MLGATREGIGGSRDAPRWLSPLGCPCSPDLCCLVSLQGAAEIPANTIQEAVPRPRGCCKRLRALPCQARTLATSTTTWLEQKPSPRQFGKHGSTLKPFLCQGCTCSWPSRKLLRPQPALVHGSCVALPPLNGARGQPHQAHLRWFKLVWAHGQNGGAVPWLGHSQSTPREAGAPLQNQAQAHAVLSQEQRWLRRLELAGDGFNLI